MRVDQGVDALDSFWVTMLNLTGQPILTGSISDEFPKGNPDKPFRIELWSAASPEMQALINTQQDRNALERFRLRDLLEREGVQGKDREERIFKFFGQELTETSFDTILHAVKSWENFPRLLDPSTRKPLPIQESEWPPVCDQEHVQAFLVDNPDMFRQLKREFDERKNYLKELDVSSLTSSSDTQKDKLNSTSQNQTESPSDPT